MKNLISALKLVFRKLLPIVIGIALLFLVAYLLAIADKFNFRLSFQPTKTVSPTTLPQKIGTTESLPLSEQINPPEGYEINATFGDIGPKLLAIGAIDLEKMKNIYQRAGQPLTEKQIKILTQGSNEKIKITPENSYFLLNFLWAAGLANKNSILDEGPMMKYGKENW